MELLFVSNKRKSTQQTRPDWCLTLKTKSQTKKLTGLSLKMWLHRDIQREHQPLILVFLETFYNMSVKMYPNSTVVLNRSPHNFFWQTFVQCATAQAGQEQRKQKRAWNLRACCFYWGPWITFGPFKVQGSQWATWLDRTGGNQVCRWHRERENRGPCMVRNKH